MWPKTPPGARPRLFRDVFYPEGDGFFRRNGLLYLELDELQALGDRLAEVQPLLSALAEDPSLPRHAVPRLNHRCNDDYVTFGQPHGPVAIHISIIKV